MTDSVVPSGKSTSKLPTTVVEKIETAYALKLSGNKCFKNGDMKGAVKNYKKVFLYINGLHGANSEMRQFTNMMGADGLWDKKKQGDETDGGEGNEVEFEKPSQEEEVKQLKVDINSNLALA